MTPEEYNDLYSESFNKQMRIVVEDTDIVITNPNICSETMSINESLNSDVNLKFGSCESNCFQIRVANIESSLKSKWLDVNMDVAARITPETWVTENGEYVVDEMGNELMFGIMSEPSSIPLGRYKVKEDVPTNDRCWRDLTCFDVMYDILNADVAEWFQSLTFPMTIKDFRDSFFTYLDIEQVETTLINDSFVTQGGFVVDGQLAGKTIINAICEWNACFGHITTDGKFDYVYIPNGDSVTLNWYIDGSGSYEDYTVQKITGIIARSDEEDVGTTVGTTVNPYIIENNPLIYGSEGSDLTDALTNILNAVKDITYRPFKVRTYGNPMLKLGTAISISTRNKTINSVVINKFMKGIQSLTDELSAEGDEYVPSKVNDVQSQIQRTKGKLHNLKIDIDSFESEINDTVDELREGIADNTSLIRQTSKEILETVSSNTNNYDTKSYTVTLFGYSIPDNQTASEHNGEYYLNQSNGNLYQSNGGTWVFVETLSTIQSSLMSTMEITAQGIVQTVSSTTKNYDLEDYTVSLYGYGAPDNSIAIVHDNEYYLNQSNGYLYLSNGVSWTFVKTLKSVQESLEAAITLTSGEIVLKVDRQGRIVQVALSGDTSSGTVFTVNADNLNLSASDIITLMAGGTLTLGGQNGVVISGTNFSVDANGNVIITGTITAVDGQIGGWEIGSNTLKYETDSTHFIQLNSVNKSIIMRDGDKKVAVTTGGIKHYYNEQETTYFRSEIYDGTSSASNKRGTAINIESGATYFDLGYKSGNDYLTALMINNGLNPNGNTQRVLITGTSRFSDEATFVNGATFKAPINMGDNSVKWICASNDWAYIRAADFGTADDGYLELATGDNGSEPIFVSQNTGYATSPTEVRRAYLLDRSGNTTFPGSLNVGGTILASGNNFAGASSVTSGERRIGVQVSGHNCYMFQEVGGRAGFYRFDGTNYDRIIQLVTNGNIQIGNAGSYVDTAGHWHDASSIKVKKNIEDIREEDALNVLNLRPVKFDYKWDENDNQNQVGLIAEEVEKIYPELVGEEYKDIGNPEYQPKSLNYVGLIPYLIKIVQMQQEEINMLKAKLRLEDER